MDREQILDQLNAGCVDTLMATLGIRYVDVGENFLVASMPVGPPVHQPAGILHGGATAALAESVGSAASALRLDLRKQTPVGLELSINHLKSLREGLISARAELVHGGRSTHLWDIRIQDEQSRQLAWARLSMMILDRAV
ncbi:MAG: PaaI family thioesterase [Wenzhouxiangella sp.]